MASSSPLPSPKPPPPSSFKLVTGGSVVANAASRGFGLPLRSLGSIVSGPSTGHPPATPCLAPFTVSTGAPLTASVGSPHSTTRLQWNLDGRHLLALNVAACAVAISASWLFFSAIPSILAFKRSAESLEKLLDVTREELPDTMAAVRLSGMEISDLTIELSDLGQVLSQGVRNSTRAVRLAEDRLRYLITMSPTVPMRTQVTRSQGTKGEPVVATAARSLREGISRGRALIGVVLTLFHLTRVAFNFFADRRKKKMP